MLTRKSNEQNPPHDTPHPSNNKENHDELQQSQPEVDAEQSNRARVPCVLYLRTAAYSHPSDHGTCTSSNRSQITSLLRQ